MHQVSDARRVNGAFISVNRLRHRKSDFHVGDWIMDSGAFSEISRFGEYRHPVSEYADQIRRWKRCGNLLAAVAQDYMCEPFIVAKTGLTVFEHQKKTVERYDQLAAENTGVYIMPVLQGYEPFTYVRHLLMYGSRLAEGAWVGVGSVCKRNGSPQQVARVFHEILWCRPDLKLHGFGIKLTSLNDSFIQSMLHSADSMAWSFHERKNGRSANHWSGAQRYVERVAQIPYQEQMFPGGM
jgi:hypothetical protein